jgi:hypothetical protein
MYLYFGPKFYGVIDTNLKQGKKELTEKCQKKKHDNSVEEHIRFTSHESAPKQKQHQLNPARKVTSRW